MVRTILFWVAAVVSFLLLAPIAYLVKSKKKRVHAIQRLWSRLLMRVSGVRLHMAGQEHIEPYGSYVVMANHQSYVDIFVILTLPVFIHWMAKKELFKIPFFGQMLRIIGGISIDRNQRGSGVASIKQAARIIREGATVLIFPEGTRSPTGELLPFNEGGFFLAILSKAVVLPVVITGTRKIMPKGSFRVAAGAVHVTVKPPMDTKEFTLKDRGVLQEKIRSLFLEELQQHSEP